MDRLIATNSVAIGDADGPPVSGTPQYATDGDPTVPTPATEFPAYQYNAIQEELIAVIAAGGLSPNKGVLTQLRDAIRALITPTPQTYTLVAPFATSGMPAAVTQAVSAGPLEFLFKLGAPGKYTNNNGSLITPKLTATIRDLNSGGTILKTVQWAFIPGGTIPISYADWLNLLDGSFKVPAPASGTYWIQITNTQSDGGSHAWASMILTGTIDAASG